MLGAQPHGRQVPLQPPGASGSFGVRASAASIPSSSTAPRPKIPSLKQIPKARPDLEREAEESSPSPMRSPGRAPAELIVYDGRKSESPEQKEEAVRSYADVLESFQT